MKLAVIYGSQREGRMCDDVAGWALKQIHGYGGFTPIIVDPAEVGSLGWETMEARLQEADAFLILTPEYNHSFPAILKELIDRFGRPWQLKPAAFISYGGRSGGLRAAEQLRLVFAELHTVCIRTSVGLPIVWDLFAKGGQPGEDYERLARRMLTELAWWSTLLASARTSGPNYLEVAA